MRESVVGVLLARYLGGALALITTLVASTQLVAQTDCCGLADDCCCCPDEICLYSTYLTARHTFGEGLGYDHGYTTLEAMFYPSWCCNTNWVFFDFRIHRFTNCDWAANGGIGIRCPAICEDRIYGLNLYYDYLRNDCHSLNFHQIGIGFEALGECYDLRVNAYFPLQDKQRVKSCFFDDYEGGFFISQKEYRESLTGVDLEVGAHITDICGLNFYGAIGPYYYNADCFDFVGGRARLMACIDTCIGMITGQGLITYDCHFSTRWQAEVGISFPLFPRCEVDCGQSCRVRDIYRNEIIVVDKNCRWKTNF
ncbi:MAG: hypothetical protein K940chlam2_00582 [Chlamydiae bacterium]|nr:hypothetical protein [Chlamydiota bacterium]